MITPVYTALPTVDIESQLPQTPEAVWRGRRMTSICADMPPSEIVLRGGLLCLVPGLVGFTMMAICEFSSKECSDKLNMAGETLFYAGFGLAIVSVCAWDVMKGIAIREVDLGTRLRRLFSNI